MPVLPFVKALYLCDYQFGGVAGKTDLYGLFNVIRPRSYPHVQERFCVFAQMVGGLGNVPFFVDVAVPGQVPNYTTETRSLRFPDRQTTVQLALEIRGCRFERPGIYIVELYCENTWVADTQLLLRTDK